MENLSDIGIILISYLIGSIPFGFLFVKLKTGKDIRDVKSGRTGGTNAGRVAGVGVGATTAIVDVFKGTVAVMLARGAGGENAWLEVFSAIAAIAGHNYSIFLIQRLPDGKIRLGGGAGGATCFGGSLGLWPGSALILLPIAGLIFYFIGYASVATLSVAFVSTIIFGVRAYLDLTPPSPPEYLFFGLLGGMIMLWSLRPNIKRLREGTERLHGYRAKNNISE